MVLLLHWGPQSTSNESQQILEIMVGVFDNFYENRKWRIPQ